MDMKMTKKIQTNSLTDGLVAYYPFNGNANDESGNGNHGAVYNAVLSSDRLGNTNSAYSFDGLSSYIEVVDGAQFDFPNDMSISVWVKAGLYQSDEYAVILSKGVGTSNAKGSFTIHQCESRTNFYFFSYVPSPNTYSAAGWDCYNFFYANENQWKHFTVVKQDNSVSYYLNGVLSSVQNNIGSSNIISSGSLPFLIGATNKAFTIPASNLVRFFHGSLDDLSIYNRALTSEEVEQLYNYNLAPTPSPTTPTPVNLKGISTLREGQVANECFEAEVRFDVPGKTESLTYITTQEANGYSYVRDNKYSGSAYLEVLKLANIALKYSASYREFKAVSENSYSTTIGVVHRLPVMFANPTLNTLGREIYKTTTPEDFKFKCGDKIIATYDSFITVTATLNYIFKSKSEVVKFKNDISISNGINNWLQGNIDTSYTDRFSKYSGYLSLTIEQFGGNPAALTNVVSKLGFCELSKISSCAELLASVNEYISSDTFEQQLDHSRWNTRFIANLEDYPISTIPEVDTTKYQSDYIPDDLYDARSSLINKLTQVTSDYTYLKELKNFITGGNCETTAEYSNKFIREVENSLAIVNGYLAKLIDSGSGIQACYSNYAKCVSEIAPNLLENAYDYSKIQISKSICEPINCDYPGISEIGLNGLEQDENWYIDKFFPHSEECYYGCVRTNTACSTADYEDDISNGSLLAPDMCFVAGAAIASMAGIIFL